MTVIAITTILRLHHDDSYPDFRILITVMTLVFLLVLHSITILRTLLSCSYDFYSQLLILVLVLFLFVAAAVVVGMLVCFVIRVFRVFRCLGFRLLKGLGASESDLQMLKDLEGFRFYP